MNSYWRRWTYLLCILTVSGCATESSPVIGPAKRVQMAVDGNGRELPWPVPNAEEVSELTAELKKQLDGTFQILTVGPWIVATDLPPNSIRRYTDATISLYSAAIQRQLFNKTPCSKAHKVYLFKDADSYQRWNIKLFGGPPTTPYGFYRRDIRSLVMNIGTGGGTLIHEMVHAMAEADFPEIPSWLNEGIGSLYEATDMDAKGRVVGITNWRLKGLQKDLAARTATPLKDLLGMDRDTFYGERSGSNYAVARYLMQYLQNHGKLEDFYRRIRDGKDADPKTALLNVFENKYTLDQIETSLHNWVKTLQF